MGGGDERLQRTILHRTLRCQGGTSRQTRTGNQEANGLIANNRRWTEPKPARLNAEAA